MAPTEHVEVGARTGYVGHAVFTGRLEEEADSVAVEVEVAVDSIAVDVDSVTVEEELNTTEVSTAVLISMEVVGKTIIVEDAQGTLQTAVSPWTWQTVPMAQEVNT